MFNYITNLINSQKLHKILLYSFVFSLFFPIRHIFLTNSAYLIGQYSDFTSFSLYLSDILLFFLFGLTLYLNFRLNTSFFKLNAYSLMLIAFIFWLILGIIWHFKAISGLNIYFFFKLIEFAVVAYGTGVLISNFKFQISKTQLFSWFVGFSLVQSLIAISQFYKQTSLGLYRLGESHLSDTTDNVAKLLVNGQTYIRAYGTFPHPNLLAAFLVTAIIFSIYFFLNSNKKWQFAWGISTFLNILGLTVTFSRAAYLAMALGLVIFFSSLLIVNRKSINDLLQKIIMVILIVIVSSAFSLLLFRSFLLTRVTISDNAITERVEYNNIGMLMIKDNPIFGAGAGESVLHMEQYSNTKLEPWQKQPIHNYFLLSAAELGIPGALLLIWFFLSSLKSLIFNLKSSQDPKLISFHLSLFSVFSAFLILMLFDHYFYTLQQTQLLLWITLGIIAVTTKKEANAS